MNDPFANQAQACDGGTTGCNTLSTIRQRLQFQVDEWLREVAKYQQAIAILDSNPHLTVTIEKLVQLGVYLG